MKNLLWIIPAALLVGCAGGPPHDYYNPVVANPPKFSGPLSIEFVDDLDAAQKKLVADGYMLIGTSVYGGDQPKRVELEAQAKRVHANKIIYHVTPAAPGSWHVHVGMWGGSSGNEGVSILYLGK